MGDPLDPPAGGAQKDHLPFSRLVNELLVQLPDPVPGFGVDTELAGVGDGPGRSHGHVPGAGEGMEHVVHWVPRDTGSQGEPGAGHPPGQHLQHPPEGGLGEVPVGVGPADDPQDLLGGDGPGSHHGHDPLGQDIHWAFGDLYRRQVHLPHPPGHRGQLQQIRPGLGDEPTLGRRPEQVPGPTHPLQGPGHRPRRLHLTHQLHQPHIDPQLQGGGGHQDREFPGLERLLQGPTPLLRHRTVVDLGQLLAGQLVELGGCSRTRWWSGGPG